MRDAAALLHLDEIPLPAFFFAADPAGAAIAAAVRRRDAPALRAILAKGVSNGTLAALATSLALHFEGKGEESLSCVDRASYPDLDWRAVGLIVGAFVALEQANLSLALTAANAALSVVALQGGGPNRMEIIAAAAHYIRLIDDSARTTSPTLRDLRKTRRAGPLCYVVSFPRSGNTMVMNALAQIFGTAKHSVFPGDGRFFSRYLYDRTDTSVMLVKDHLFRSEYLKEKVVYIVRDGRDAMVSLSQFLSGNEMPPVTTRTEFATFLAQIASAYAYGFWSENVALALEAKEAGADVMIARYEDLRRDPTEFYRIAAHITPDRIVMSDPTKLVAHLQGATARLAHLPEWGLGAPAQSALFDTWSKHRGGSNWQSVFNAPARKIFHQLGGTEMLLQFGYEVDPDWWRHD